MIEVKALRIINFSSENDLFPASNLLKETHGGKWHCKNLIDDDAFVEFEFENYVNLEKIEIGNNNSAFVKILVIDENDRAYHTLLLSSPLMSSVDAARCESGTKVRVFDESHFIGQAQQRKWKCLRVECRQPFNKSLSYGLSFIRFYGSILSMDQGSAPVIIDVSQLMTETSDQWKPGSLFSGRSAAVRSCPSIQERLLTAQTLPINHHHKIMTENQQVLNDFPIEASAVNKSLSGKSSTTENDSVVKNPAIKHDSVYIRPSKVSDNVCPSSGAVTTQDNIKCENMLDVNQTIDTRISTKSCRDDIPLSTSIDLNIQSSALSNDNIDPASQSSTPQTRPYTKEPANTNQILSGVSFVISGYQNPLRNILRDNGMALGAKYRPSWSDDCTHLICAFPNTPKFKEVCGRGIIVSDGWILNCYKEKKQLPWREYRVKGALSPTIGVDRNIGCGMMGTRKRSASEQLSDSPSSIVGKKRREECDTDDEIEMVAIAMSEGECGGVVAPVSEVSGVCGDETLGLPELPSVFAGMTFFLYGCFEYEERRRLIRLVRVCGGVVAEYMCDQVQVVVTTSSSWDPTFDEALVDHGHLRFVCPAWLHACDQSRCLCPLADYELRP